MYRVVGIISLAMKSCPQVHKPVLRVVDEQYPNTNNQSPDQYTKYLSVYSLITIISTYKV